MTTTTMMDATVLPTTSSRPGRTRGTRIGGRLARLAALTLGTCLALATPGEAFHDSALEPRLKQVLARFLQAFSIECRQGNQAACVSAQQVQAVGNQLGNLQLACHRGDARACQAVQLVHQQFAALLSAAPSGYGARIQSNPYDRRAQVPPGPPYGNPYDWRSWEPKVERPRGNPYDWRSWEPEPKGPVGNPYDWKNWPESQ